MSQQTHVVNAPVLIVYVIRTRVIDRVLNDEDFASLTKCIGSGKALTL